jgi:hypothetical protein
MADGVTAVAANPCQELTSKPLTPPSSTVGASGSFTQRFWLVTVIC